MRYINFIIILILFITISCSSQQVNQNPNKTGHDNKEKQFIEEQQVEPVYHVKTGTALNKIDDNFFDDQDLPADAGFILYDTSSGKTIFEHNSLKAYIPASTAKIPVSVFALRTLGEYFRFETSLYITGDLSEGVLTGDLYLKGGGDPYLDANDLLSLVHRLKVKGIKKIDGRLFYDESGFESVSEIDTAMRPHAGYNPAIGYLSVESNLFKAFWHRKPGSGDMELFTVPDLPSLSIKIAKSPLQRGIPFRLEENGDVEEWLLPHNTRRAGNAEFPVKNPGRFTAQLFAKLCRIHSIETPGPQKGKTPEDAIKIGEHLSPPLNEYVQKMMTESSNLAAELIMLKAAETTRGYPPTMEEAGEDMKNYFKEKIEGIDWSAFKITRGSGLTSANRLTPQQLLAILLYYKKFNTGYTPYYQYFPIGGWESSTERRFREPDNAFRVYAKAGAINYVLSLSGYLYTTDGKELAFAVMISDIEKRKNLEEGNSSATEREIRHWMHVRRSAIDDLIAGWIESHSLE